jgi:hypothetical protein
MALLAASQALVLVELGLVVAALAGALAWLGRRAKAVDPGVLRTIRLSPSHMVYVVAIEDRRLLIGAGPGAAPELICDLTEKPRPGREVGPRTDPGRVATSMAAGTRSRGGWDHGD